MLTYLILTFVVKQSGDGYTLVSVCLLLSAGTFLYVATMHVIPEVYGVAAHDHDHEHDHDSHDHLINDHEHKEQPTSRKLLDTAILTAGAFIPLFISLFLDEHGH
jgi:zinc transporter 9